jgi:hypothetical protein
LQVVDRQQQDITACSSSYSSRTYGDVLFSKKKKKKKLEKRIKKNIIYIKKTSFSSINSTSMPRRSSRGRGGRGKIGAAAAAAAAAARPTPEAKRAERARARWARLHKRDAELVAAIEKLEAEREAVLEEMEVAENELDAAVNAPVSGGRDPFEWLPDELLVVIMRALPADMMWVCDRVCERWKRVIESGPILKMHKWNGRWAAYEMGEMEPQALEVGMMWVRAVAVGLDGKVYSSLKKTIQVWSGEDGAHLNTLEGHDDTVRALAVGLDGKVYSGSEDETIRVWSGENGAHMHTLEGGYGIVYAIAVALDGKIFSGWEDDSIRVWSGEDGALLFTLEGAHVSGRCLAVGPNSIVCSAGIGKIHVWSDEDGTLLDTLDVHEDNARVRCLAVGQDGTIYAGDGDGYITAWSSETFDFLDDLPSDSPVNALVVGPDGRLFSADAEGDIKVWSSDWLSSDLEDDEFELSRKPRYLVPKSESRFVALAFGPDGTLYSGGRAGKGGCLLKW